MQPERSLQGWLARLESLHPKAIDLGLERSREVLQRLDFQLGCPVLLVAGTNGKGSTCAYLEAILQSAGYRTGLYTSPHLLRYNERVRIDGKDCNDEAIVAGLAAVEAVRGKTSLTYFEHGTLGAAWQFARAKVEVAILEVGLGGRLDTVNLFEPDASIVTSVDLDHQDWLGADREAIGFEKAGIFRPGKPAVCADPQPPLSLRRQARNIRARLQLIGQDFGYRLGTDNWQFYWYGQSLSCLPLPAMAGEFQVRNAAAALAGLLNMQDSLPVTEAAMNRGLREARAAARFQQIAAKPQIILDVAHNPEAARALAGNLMARPVAGRTLAVFALLADKDLPAVVSPLQPLIDAWYVCGLEGPRTRPAQELARDIGRLVGDKSVGRYASPAEGCAAALSVARENDRILVFGSFHTVASVLVAHPTWQFR
ncbi:MAG TPA: bifunctional tetrahydrofolate synthase/dihydrofolate synthase [Thiobacillaceae bacterium]|nr:bifunctional tetrahydrofolate synthase/dihydrofolate synthase [Thiobacillaceae bacterium]